MAEKGSDQMLKEMGAENVDAMIYEEQVRQQEEEERLRAIRHPRDDPGETQDIPDEAPPADEAHDEYDPEPPPG